MVFASYHWGMLTRIKKALGFKTVPVETPLEKVVKQYINELANPSPDSIMRSIIVKHLAELVGMEDPVVTRCRWLNDAQRSSRQP